jgi:hypothetical protein
MRSSAAPAHRALERPIRVFDSDDPQSRELCQRLQRGRRAGPAGAPRAGLDRPNHTPGARARIFEYPACPLAFGGVFSWLALDCCAAVTPVRGEERPMRRESKPEGKGGRQDPRRLLRRPFWSVAIDSRWSITQPIDTEPLADFRVHFFDVPAPAAARLPERGGGDLRRDRRPALARDGVSRTARDRSRRPSCSSRGRSDAAHRRNRPRRASASGSGDCAAPRRNRRRRRRRPIRGSRC